MCSPWQQPDHPDPLGINLRRLASVLEVFLKKAGGTYAVFFDFASLMQKPASGAEREPNEAKLFSIALTNMMVRRPATSHSHPQPSTLEPPHTQLTHDAPSSDRSGMRISTRTPSS